MTTKKAVKKVTPKKVASKPVPKAEPVGPSPAERCKLPIAEAYPEAPGLDTRFGDKDPDFVRWLHKTHPEDFAIRFKGRRTVMDPKPKKGEPSFTKKCVQAQRNGFYDASDRKGYNASEYGYTGVLESEYKTGYKNGGGVV
jgi:hypothetical protein